MPWLLIFVLALCAIAAYCVLTSPDTDFDRRDPRYQKDDEDIFFK